MLLYSESESDIEKVYKSLQGASDKFTVYRLRELPPKLHFDENERSGDPVVVASGPYVIPAHATNPPDNPPHIKGMHGYDPARFKTMRAIFYAAGPDIRSGAVVDPFENVNIFPLIVKILGLKPAPNDGDAKVLQDILHSASRK
jgi:hypothetical protein